MLKLYRENKVEIIDIRLKEENKAWKTGIGIHIPFNEIPDLLDEIETEKTIVTMCPHYDRAEIARLYLMMQGYDSRYLTDSMLGLANCLRGDTACDYMSLIEE